MSGGFRGGHGGSRSGNYSRGHGDGCGGGRSNSTRRSNLRSNRSENTPIKEYKFVTHGVGKQGQTMMFNTVKDHIIYYVQKNYPFGLDIASSIRDEQKFEIDTVKPKRVIGAKMKEEDRRFEQDGFYIDYTAEMKEFMERK